MKLKTRSMFDGWNNQLQSYIDWTGLWWFIRYTLNSLRDIESSVYLWCKGNDLGRKMMGTKISVSFHVTPTKYPQYLPAVLYSPNHELKTHARKRGMTEKQLARLIILYALTHTGQGEKTYETALQKKDKRTG